MSNRFIYTEFIFYWFSGRTQDRNNWHFRNNNNQCKCKNTYWRFCPPLFFVSLKALLLFFIFVHFIRTNVLCAIYNFDSFWLGYKIYARFILIRETQKRSMCRCLHSGSACFAERGDGWIDMKTRVQNASYLNCVCISYDFFFFFQLRPCILLQLFECQCPYFHRVFIALIFSMKRKMIIRTKTLVGNWLVIIRVIILWFNRSVVSSFNSLRNSAW